MMGSSWPIATSIEAMYAKHASERVKAGPADPLHSRSVRGDQPPPELIGRDVIDETYLRCDQENVIEQLGSGLAMWRTPVKEFAGNEAWIETLFAALLGLSP
ncbi:hypothetical protein WMF38_57820 [Sorangium sp. So ce118]